MGKRKWRLLPLLFAFVLSACMNTNGVEQQDKGEIQKLRSEIEMLKNQLAAQEQLVHDLQMQIDEAALISDKVTLIMDNSKLLFDAAKRFERQLPILVHAEDELEKKILENINFHDEIIDIRENELMLFAGMGKIHPDDPIATVEITVYQNPAVIEEAGPIKVMFLGLRRDGDLWIIESFNRSN